MEVVGHRGCRGLEPENTLRAFRRGIEIGCDYVETDVRLSLDGQLVIMHDDTVDRTTNGSGKIAELSFEEIRSLDAGEGEQVPTLAEVLETTGRNVQLLCELKDDAGVDGAVREVLAIGLENVVVFTSF
ncbi:MAG: glycerophosphodiester phosphodiesterase family protein, partial [Planctomycetota bacterium]|nr:glycerophosphodiester phosphodiesterase family protein [Planctomycetota bacterium]